jgi:hypothetical protein
MDLNLSSLHYIFLKEIILNGYSPNIETLSKIFQRLEEDITQCLNDLQEYHGIVLHLKTFQVWIIHPFSLSPTNFWVKSNKGHPGRRLRPLDPAGSCRKEAGTSPDPAEKPRKSPEVEAVFRPEIYWIFSGEFLSISCAFRQEPVGNHRKKSDKFPVGILLPRSSDFRCFPAGTSP